MEARPQAVSMQKLPLFADERRFWRFFAWIAAAIAILKGLRLPIIWAATQAQADYREGLIKRGLFGEICRRLRLPIADYRVFTLVAFAILIVFLLQLLRFVRGARLSASAHGPLITLMCASYALSYLVSMVGYLDILLAMMAMAVLSVRRPAAQLAGVAVVGSLAIVVHEMYAIVFLPLTALPYLLGQRRRETKRPSRRAWIALTAALALPCLTTLLLTAHRALTPDEIGRLQREVLARVNFPAEPMVFDIYSMSGLANLRMMERYLRTGSWMVLEALALAAFLPATVYFLLIAFRALERGGEKAEGWLRVAFVIAVFAPLAMNLLAYDQYRWTALMAFNSMLAAVVVLRTRKVQPEGAGDESQRSATENGGTRSRLLSPALRRGAYLLIALNLATNIGMFAHEGKDFPFYQYWSDFVTARHAPGSWLHP